MRPTILEARSAREGGGLTITAELFPRIADRLARAGHEVRTLIGPPATARERAVRRRAYATARAILHAGNRATLSPARKVVMVQDRLLLETGLPRVNNTPRYRVRRSLLIPALTVADAVVVPSESMLEPLDRFRRRFRIPSRPTEAILHGRPSWSAPPDRPMVDPAKLLFAGHPLWHKNFPLLAELLDAAARRGRDLRVTVTARPEQEVDGRRLVEWLPGRAVTFAGEIPRDRLPELYAAHDALLFPSLYESFGLPLIEAMTTNMPIIVSDREWAREVAGDAAVYADPAEASAWLDAIEDVVTRGVRSNAEGRARAERFDWDEAAARYAQLLDPTLRLA